MALQAKALEMKQQKEDRLNNKLTLGSEGSLLSEYANPALRPPAQPSSAALKKKTHSAVPQIPQDFSANTADFILLPQGDYTQFTTSSASEDYTYTCCALKSNCKIQTEYEAGPNFVSATLQQTRFGGGLGQQAIVSDYKTDMKQYLVNGSGYCQSYCNLQVGSEVVPVEVNESAKDLGPVNIGGDKFEHWQWKDKIGKIFLIDQVDAFVNQSDPANPKPYIWATIIEPFKKLIGFANTTYNDFEGGAQDEKLFLVTGKEHCEVDPNCASSTPQFD